MGGPQDYRSTGAPVSAIRDDADTGDERRARVVNLAPLRFPEHLADCFREVEAAAGKAGLAGGNLAAAGIERQRTAIGEIRVENVIGALATFAKAEGFHLHQNGNGEIV